MQATIFWFLWTLFRPAGTLYDLNVGFCLMLLSPRSLARMGVVKTLLSVCAIVVPVLLYIVLYWMWLETGSGEANFLYFQCLAYNIFVANLLVEFCGASVRRDKALRLTLKQDKGTVVDDNGDKEDRSNPDVRDDTVLDDQ
jgi:phosphatidylinositol glycan class U